MELARIHSSQLQGSSARPSHFLDAETCEFTSLSMFFQWGLLCESVLVLSLDEINNEHRLTMNFYYDSSSRVG